MLDHIHKQVCCQVNTPRREAFRNSSDASRGEKMTNSILVGKYIKGKLDNLLLDMFLLRTVRMVSVTITMLHTSQEQV